MRLKRVPPILSLRLFAVAFLLAIPGSLRAQDFGLLEATIEDAHAAMERGQLT